MKGGGIIFILLATFLFIVGGIHIEYARESGNEDMMIKADKMYFVFDALWKFTLCGSLLLVFRRQKNQSWAALFSFLTMITLGNFLDEVFLPEPWQFNRSEYVWAVIGGATALLEYFNIRIIIYVYNWLCQKLQ